MLPLRARVDIRAMTIKGYTAFPNAPALLGRHSQIVWSYIKDTHLGGSYLSARCSRCILQPQPTRPLVGGVLPLCKDAVCVFYSLSRLGQSLEESYPYARMQSVYSTALADWASRWRSFNPLKRCSRCILLIGPVVNWLPSWEIDTVIRVIIDEAVCITHSTNTLGNVMNPSILPPVIGKS